MFEKKKDQFEETDKMREILTKGKSEERKQREKVKICNIRNEEGNTNTDMDVIIFKYYSNKLE